MKPYSTITAFNHGSTIHIVPIARLQHAAGLGVVVVLEVLTLAEHVFSLNHLVVLLKAMVITATTTPRLAACWSPDTSSTTSPHSTGRGVLARTLCCTTDVTVHPSGVLPLLCY